MKQLASHSGARLEAFQSWFDQWAEGLWGFTHFYALVADEYRDDFLDVLHAARPKISKSLAIDSSGRRGVGIFLKTWFSRLKKNRQHSSYNGVALSWEDQFLLFAVFRMNWSDELVADLMRLPLSAVKFRLFTALCKEAKISDSELAQISRDCSRFDLYFGDLLLGQKWKDPLNIVDRAEIKKHGQHCMRCQLLQENLRICVDQLRLRNLFKIPTSFRNEIREEFGARWQLLFSGEWFSDLPWTVRVPAQIGLAGLAVWGVLFLSAKDASLDRIFKRGEQGFLKVQSSATYAWDSTRSTVREWFDDWKLHAPVPEVSEGEGAAPPLAEEGVFKEVVRHSDTELLKLALEKNSKVSVVDAIPAAAPVLPPAATPTSAPLAVSSKPVVSLVPTSPAASSTGTSGNEKLFYRWFAVSKNIEVDSSKILEILKKYNAVQAGDLALGGSYQGGKYFHFAVPKEVFESVFEEIKALGLLGLTSNEARSGMRRTPVDQRRAVFTLMPSKEASSSKGAKSLTPAVTSPPAELAPSNVESDAGAL